MLFYKQFFLFLINKKGQKTKQKSALFALDTQAESRVLLTISLHAKNQ